MYEFRVRFEFDVEVDDPSFIDAAFAAAEWLQDPARQFSRASYEIASHRAVPIHGTQFVTVDLEDIEPEDDDSVLVDEPRWVPRFDPTLPNGRAAAWPYVVVKGDEYIRTNNGDGRVVRYSSVAVAQKIADIMNRKA